MIPRRAFVPITAISTPIPFSRGEIPGKWKASNYLTLPTVPQTVPLFLPCVVRFDPLQVAILSITSFPLVTVGRTLAGLLIKVMRTGGSRGNIDLTLPPFDILLL